MSTLHIVKSVSYSAFAALLLSSSLVISSTSASVPSERLEDITKITYRDPAYRGENHRQFTLWVEGFQNAENMGISNVFSNGGVENPNVPLIHPYNILDDLNERVDHGVPHIPLVAHIPSFELRNCPAPIREHVQVANSQRIKIFLSAQNLPWNAPLCFRPHYATDPNAPLYGNYWSERTLNTILLVSPGNRVQLQGARDGKLIGFPISTHPAGSQNPEDGIPGFTTLSGDSLHITGLSPDRPETFWTCFTYKRNDAVKETIITLHWALTDLQCGVLTRMLTQSSPAKLSPATGSMSKQTLMTLMSGINNHHSFNSQANQIPVLLRLLGQDNYYDMFVYENAHQLSLNDSCFSRLIKEDFIPHDINSIELAIATGNVFASRSNNLQAINYDDFRDCAQEVLRNITTGSQSITLQNINSLINLMRTTNNNSANIRENDHETSRRVETRQTAQRRPLPAIPQSNQGGTARSSVQETQLRQNPVIANNSQVGTERNTNSLLAEIGQGVQLRQTPVTNNRTARASNPLLAEVRQGTQLRQTPVITNNDQAGTTGMPTEGALRRVLRADARNQSDATIVNGIMSRGNLFSQIQGGRTLRSRDDNIRIETQTADWAQQMERNNQATLERLEREKQEREEAERAERARVTRQAQANFRAAQERIAQTNDNSSHNNAVDILDSIRNFGPTGLRRAADRVLAERTISESERLQNHLVNQLENRRGAFVDPDSEDDLSWDDL